MRGRAHLPPWSVQVTQPGAESVQGEVPEEQPEPASGRPLTDGIAASLLEGYGLEAELDEPETEPTSEEEHEEPEAAIEATAEAPKLTPEQQVPQWVQRVSQNPKSISEVPAKFHPQVMEAVMAEQLSIQQRAIQIAYEQGSQQAEARVKAEAEVARIDEFRKDDPAGFTEWEDTYPDRAEAYRAIKRNRTPQGQIQVNQAAVQQQTIQATAQNLMAKLAEFPDAQARIAQLDSEPGRYAPDAAGLARLQADVTDAIVDARLAARDKTETPAQQALAQRQQAANGRREIPRPDVNGARGASSIDPLADINDATELISMGLANFFKSDTPKVNAARSR